MFSLTIILHSQNEVKFGHKSPESWQ